MTPVVVAENVGLSYKRKRAVEHFSLQIPPGITALLGPNGAGKSTLLQAIATAKPIDVGSLSVLGHSTSSSGGIQQIRKVSSFLPQAPGFQRSFSVADHLRYSSWLKSIKPSPSEYAEVLTLLDLTSVARQRLKTLSGGQLRRAMLAGALVTRPSLLILDEPTVGLDPVQRRAFKATISNLPNRPSVLFSGSSQLRV